LEQARVLLGRVRAKRAEKSLLLTGLAGVELMHMIRKDQFAIDGAATMSFADQFYVLGQIRPV
jgi:hypothetical protein